MRSILLCMLLTFCSTLPACAWSESLLPPPSEFRLTLREDAHAKLPWARMQRGCGSAIGYDDDALRHPGTYQLRLTYYPYACAASADASFCLTGFPDESMSAALRLQTVPTPVIQVRTTADAPPRAQRVR